VLSEAHVHNLTKRPLYFVLAAALLRLLPKGACYDESACGRFFRSRLTVLEPGLTKVLKIRSAGAGGACTNGCLVRACSGQ
jgi:hypothetical protein